jgi:hypothetical protein
MCQSAGCDFPAAAGWCVKCHLDLLVAHEPKRHALLQRILKPNQQGRVDVDRSVAKLLVTALSHEAAVLP